MTNHQGLNSPNLLTFPLDIPEVEVVSIEINERAITSLRWKAYATLRSVKLVGNSSRSLMDMGARLNCGICLF